MTNSTPQGAEVLQDFQGRVTAALEDFEADADQAQQIMAVLDTRELAYRGYGASELLEKCCDELPELFRFILDNGITDTPTLITMLDAHPHVLVQTGERITSDVEADDEVEG